MDAIREMLAERVVELEDERDALAAHVETARPMVMAYRSRIGGALWSLEGEELEWAKQADAWLSYTPTSSLARLKAQWQAEALDEIAMDIRATYGHHTQYSVSLLASTIDGMADAYRRQAEGGSHG